MNVAGMLDTMSGRDTRWKSRPAHTGAPRFLLPWLVDCGSLTARLQARCSRFEVSVAAELLQVPTEDERRLVGLRRARLAWVREVLLSGDGVPLVFAHSILAPNDLDGVWRMARCIGGRPLGAALFADPAIKRGDMHSARLDPHHPLYRRAVAVAGALAPPPTVLWARRSLFRRKGRPLLVSELFLPGMAHLPR